MRKWKTNELRAGCGLGGAKKQGIQLESRGRDLGLEGGTKELGLCLRPGGAARELLPRARFQEAGPESQSRQCPRPRGRDQNQGRVRHLRPGGTRTAGRGQRASRGAQETLLGSECQPALSSDWVSRECGEPVASCPKVSAHTSALPNGPPSEDPTGFTKCPRRAFPLPVCLLHSLSAAKRLPPPTHPCLSSHGPSFSGSGFSSPPLLPPPSGISSG